MTSSKMPRRFWSYTAGKGNIRTEEIEAAPLQSLDPHLPGSLSRAFPGPGRALFVSWNVRRFRSKNSLPSVGGALRPQAFCCSGG